MIKMQTAPADAFTPGERAHIRNELSMHFSTLPTVAEGFQLRNWRGGPQAGQPKLPPVAKGLVERGLMRLETGGRWPRLLVTEMGLADGERPPRQSTKIRACPPGTRHRTGAGNRRAERVTSVGPLRLQHVGCIPSPDNSGNRGGV